ncbi:pyridoxamine 5'-phosphate oxidase family protein [Oceaniglobus ichthyenteri]|uniref:pyridoxamine 5'-phosphate oxidase family protein n=1 Tax=Oceaniglobus ichthyenteri TaxID=2136177 RepID=UPI000D391B99|nr:pyridoxamine 5'-phosphate oxidase family protein [Oceaniglobus ichthyenteri]
MSDLSQAEARDTLFEMMDDVRAGMLGVSESGQHMQPMTHFFDRDTATLWFITSKQTDLVRAVGMGATAHFTVTGEDHKAWTCMSGPISQSADRAKLDELWSVVSAAWFDEGREDPDVCLLQMPLREAALWTATGNPLMFGMEIAKANMTEDKKPDIGDHVIINFQTAA